METTPMSTNTANVLTGEGWRDSIEALVRGRIRGLIEEILEAELSDALGRARYTRWKTAPAVAATDEGGRSSDRRQLSFGHQHAPRRACAGIRLPARRGQQGHGEPGLAQDQDGLGSLECA